MDLEGVAMQSDAHPIEAGHGLARLWPFLIVRELREHKAASTLNRFFNSKHVLDLRLIFSLGLIFAIAASILVVLLQFANNWPRATTGDREWSELFAAVFLCIGYIGAIFAVYCWVVAWAYQTAIVRLGVVDLFACEIGTLTRVGTIFDVARTSIETYKQAHPPDLGPSQRGDIGRFASEEDYFPVFNSNARDLQVLEANVVVNITAFYTYMKAARDLQRRLSVMGRPAVPDTNADQWHETTRNLIYMIFLAFESARKAIEDLIEFQPLADECVITILLTEIEAYRFLLDQLGDDDFRGRRLRLRYNHYKRTVPTLYRRVTAEQGYEWDPAKETVHELKSRYETAFGTPIDDMPISAGAQ